jgi:hypothetical protein
LQFQQQQKKLVMSNILSLARKEKWQVGSDISMKLEKILRFMISIYYKNKIIHT